MSEGDEVSEHKIMAAYVKFVEMAGGMAVPIDTRLPDEELVNLTRKINGVIFPGGSSRL